MTKRHKLLATLFEQQYFRKVLKQNLTIALVAIALAFPLLVYTSYSIIQQETRLVQETAERMVVDVSNELKKVNNMAKAIGMDHNVLLLRNIANPSTSQDYLQCAKARDAVGLHSSSIDSIAELLVYVESNGSILTSECYFADGSQLNVTLDISWMPGVVERAPNKGAGYYTFPFDTLVKTTVSDGFSQVKIPVSFGYCPPVEGGVTVVVFFKADYLTDMLPSSFSDLARLKLLNGNDEVLFDYNGMGEGAAANWMVMHRSVAREGTLQVELSISFIGLLSMVSTVLLLYFGVALCALFIPVYLAYQMAVRQFAPIRKLMSKLEQYGLQMEEGASMEDGLADHLSLIFAANLSARQETLALKDILQQNTALLLYNGVPDLEHEWLTDFPEVYVVAYGRITWDSEEHKTLAPFALIRQMVRQHSGLNSMQRLGDHSFSFMIPVVEGREDEAESWVKQVLVPQVNGQFVSQVRITLSGPVQGLGNVFRTLEQQRASALSSAEEGEPKATAPFQNGMSLYHNLIAGDGELANRIIREIMRGHIVNRYGIRDIYYYVADIIRFAAQDVGHPLSNQIRSYSVNIPLDDLIVSLIQAAESICAHRAEQKASQAEDQRNAIIDYIHQNLGKYDLSIRELCDQFDYSERGMIAAINLQTGTTLANYLTQERMKEAVRLLVETNMQVGAICESVGYNTISAFHKAFKRIYGIAPGEYRKQYVHKTPLQDGSQDCQQG